MAVLVPILVLLTGLFLLLADAMDARTALDTHFLLEIVERDGIDARVAELCQRLANHAPITMRAAKEAVRRNMLQGIAEGRDLIEEVYGSADFRLGVESFLAKKRPAWTGK